jgi:hypothetical protein
MTEQIKKMKDLRDSIRRQLLLRFYFTRDPEIMLLLLRL